MHPKYDGTPRCGYDVAVMIPITNKSIGYKNKNYNLPQITKNSISNTLLNKLNDIKFGRDMKDLNWLKTISL